MRDNRRASAGWLSLALLFSAACGGPVVLTVDSGGTAGGDVAGGDESTGGDEGGDDGGSSSGGYLCINEFMASNSSTLEDDSGAFSDWIELFNDSDEVVDMTGWTITDDLEEPDKGILPERTLQPGAFLVLFADGDSGNGPLHLGFSLSADGEALGIFDPDGNPIDRLEYAAQATDISAARVPDGSLEWVLTDEPTPGESNGSGS